MTTSFQRWELLTRTALGDRGIGYHEATPLIEQARADHEQSGLDPWEALGAPADFAADVAAGQPAAQARLDTHGKTARDHLSDGLFAVAFASIPASLLAMWTNDGSTIPLTVAGSAGTALVGLALFVCLAVPAALRAAGRPRLTPWAFVLAGALVMAAAAAFTGLPKTHIGETSALGTLVVAFGVCWLLTRPGKAPSTAHDTHAPGTAQDTHASGTAHDTHAPGTAHDTHASGTASTAGAGSPTDASELASTGATDPAAAPDASVPAGTAHPLGSDSTSDPADAQAWFARLRNLLIGRFDVAPARARALVDEARAHVAAAGSHPHDEFGSLERYALELAESEPRRQPAWWRARAAAVAGRIAMLAALAVIVVSAVPDGDWWIVVTGTALLAWLGTDLRRA